MASILKVDKIRGTGLDSDTISFDGTGNITIPKNVTFSGNLSGLPSGSAEFLARFTPGTGASWANLSSGGIIRFDDVSTQDAFDTDGVFNTSTYKFTAPATGVYMFWFAVYTANTDTTNAFCFLKNDSKFRTQAAADEYLSFWGGSAQDHIQNGTIIVPLSSGDTMGVCAAAGSDYYSGHSQWGGCRLA